MEGKGLMNLISRVFQFLWTLLIMALTGNMIASSWSGSSSSPNIVNYGMFVSIFAMASLFYLIPAGIKDSIAFHSAIPFTLDLLNLIFFFCGAVAFAAELHVHSCSDVAYLVSNHITNSAPNMEKQCREAQAVTAFLWFGFAAFAVSTVVTGLGLGGSGGISRRGGVRGPQMSKV